MATQDDVTVNSTEVRDANGDLRQGVWYEEPANKPLAHLQQMSEDKLAEYRRRSFLLAHDHLISPWKYSLIERVQRDQALAKANWQRQGPWYKYETYP